MTKAKREDWFPAAFRILMQEGIDGLGVEPLCRALGMTKGSFYYHFESRRKFHLEVLGIWEFVATNSIVKDISAMPANPEDQLRVAISHVFNADESAYAIETAIRAWATNDEVVREVTQRMDDTRLSFLTQLFKEHGFDEPVAQARARLLYRTTLGELTWRSNAGPHSTPEELESLAVLLLGSSGV